MNKRIRFIIFACVLFLSFVNGWLVSDWFFFGHGFPVWWGILLFSIVTGVFWFLILFVLCFWFQGECLS